MAALVMIVFFLIIIAYLKPYVLRGSNKKTEQKELCGLELSYEQTEGAARTLSHSIIKLSDDNVVDAYDDIADYIHSCEEELVFICLYTYNEGVKSPNIKLLRVTNKDGKVLACADI